MKKQPFSNKGFGIKAKNLKDFMLLDLKRTN